MESPLKMRFLICELKADNFFGGSVSGSIPNHFPIYYKLSEHMETGRRCLFDIWKTNSPNGETSLSTVNLNSQLEPSLTRTSRQLEPIFVSLQVIFYTILPSTTRIPDNSKLFQFSLKVRVIGIRLYILKLVTIKD